MLPDIDFAKIRQHAGSQDRAFEELCYQLIPSLELLPEGTKTERYGTPDGGVEAICTLPDGSVWAWQAKYFNSFEQTQFSQMDKSVKRALETQPRLTRYIFCFPEDMPAVASGRATSALDKWASRCERWVKLAERRGLSVDFEHKGHSDLVSALTLTPNHGRLLYWFSTHRFGPEWFQRMVDQATEDARDRYDPALNVHLPIADAFDALGRTSRFQVELRTQVREMRAKRRYWPRTDLEKVDPDLVEKLRSTSELLDQLEREILAIDITGGGAVPVDDLASLCHQIVNDLSDKARQISDRADQADRITAETGTESQRDRRSGTRRNAAYWLHRLSNAVGELGYLLQSDRTRLLNTPALLLAGLPGVGKTHLMCDTARLRCSEERPTVLLLGQKFSDEEPWTQILRQLDLDCSADQFLGALSAAAEVTQDRALILIDAINESRDPRIWHQYLASVLERIRRYPRLGLVVSCRRSYVEAAIPPQLDETRLVRIEHAGFAGHEYAATKTFFDHFKLRLPDFPILVPEFQNPMFLKVMCRGIQSQGLDTIPRGSSGITWLFDLFLRQVNEELAKPHRCDFLVSRGLVLDAVRSTANEMLSSGGRSIPIEAAESLLDDLLPGRHWEKSLLNGLLTEGVLMRDRQGDSEVVMFAYDRLGDHLRASALCEAAKSSEVIAKECSALASDRLEAYSNSGLLEALAVRVPEKFKCELHELVPDPSFDAVQDAYLASLVWRDPAAFPTPVAFDYLNTISADHWGDNKVLRTLLQTACIPDHPFNADLLHRTLWRLSMPTRDKWWSTFLYWNYDEGTEVARLIDWAWSEDTSYCADDAASLCASTLAWYLTSSSRVIRDRATKAMVSLMRNRPSITVTLLDQFHGVNDPYVAERIYAVAYGCALTSCDEDAIESLASKVYDLVFAKRSPPVHLLLRDYARGIIERAAALNCLGDEVDLDNVRPPYSSPWPIRAASEEHLRSLYYDRDDGWRSIWWSVMSSMGDFNRYVIDSSVSNFLAPSQSSMRASVRRKAKARAHESLVRFVESLSQDQFGIFQEPDGWNKIDSHLSGEQRGLLDRAVLDQAKPRFNRPIPFDFSRAARWIFARVASLGWTPKRFRRFDDLRGHPLSRTEHRHERIGKKYQWIALYELLARIADHCPLTDWGSDRVDYEGPWQLFVRNIDPSLLVTRLKGTWWDSLPETWLAPKSVRFPERPDLATRHAWVRETGDLPEPAAFIDLRDPHGQRWITLEGHYQWQEPTPPEEDQFEHDRCNAWYQIRSYFVRSGDLQSFLNWANGRDWMGRWMPESPDSYKMFIGEYPWHPAARDSLSDWKVPGDEFSVRADVPVSLLPTTGGYHWESVGYDQSLDDSINARIPCPAIVRSLGLHWASPRFAYAEADDSIVARDPTSDEPGPSALIIQSDALITFLQRENLDIVWTVLGEKMVYGSGIARQSPRLVVSGALTLEAGDVRLHYFDTNYNEPR